MSVILVFLLVIAGVSFWWLSQQRLMSKPWLEHGDVLPELESTGIPTAKLGMVVLLAVIGCLFALFSSAFFMRMAVSDWQAPPLPRILWLNSLILVLSSVALQGAVSAVRKGDAGTTRLALATGGLTALAFLAGQLVAWRELAADGYPLTANPANSFFYLLTGMHGLHIVAGLVGLSATTARAWQGERPESLKSAVELCAMYWHFLLLVWLGLFVLIAGWAASFIDICRQLLS
ncbi:cytochrome-c oxidase [Mesorhizobium sp. L-8-10]|uniref:cytochrome c oxidase subunit 3 n=1 Tax=Mesorhizobium sp. L-8-10 TaxID=2744523 RepID=UPI0019265129|nr:cytochrome c oxidase subunit 3 [Mesorhizobium sp. L-8-10]BCH29054.1 cytochrome-c oxidase [Mesorhizobium sp. L-8-10]